MVLLTVLSWAIIRTKQNVTDLRIQVDKQLEEIRKDKDSKIQSGVETIEQLKMETESKNKSIEELKQQIQAKADKKNLVAQLASAVVPVAHAAPAPVDSNAAKMFIYMHESGNNPYSVNKSSGACGLAQALPCSKMGCALGNYACQDAWATNYMLHRYGSWENAMAWWVAHRWW